MLLGLGLPSVGGRTKVGVRYPHGINCLDHRRNILGWELISLKQLICGSLNGMRIRHSLPQSYTSDRDTGHLEGTAVGSRILGIVEQSQGKGCYWLQRYGLMGCEGGYWGAKCLWRNTRHHGRKGNCQVNHSPFSHHHSLFLPTHQHRLLNNIEPDQSSAWLTDLQSRTPPRGPLYVPDTPNNREVPQAREPSKCLEEWSYGERVAKEASLSPSTRCWRKDANRAKTSMAAAVSVSAHLVPPWSPQAKQLCHVHAQHWLGQSCYRHKTSSLWIITSVVSNSLWHCRLWLARLLSQGRGFYMQRYWCALANTGWHTLLEHYISCCPSHQLPWVPGAARTPVTQAVAPPHLALIGANPSPPGQSQEQTPVDDSHADMEIKP